jgi:hypothetical protein
LYEALGSCFSEVLAEENNTPLFTNPFPISKESNALDTNIQVE